MLKVNFKKTTLTIRGFFVCNTDSSIDVTTQKFDWENALIDASITAGVTFFSTLGGGSIAGLESVSAIEAATISAFTQFFVFLALKRGILSQNQNQ
jgi:hypothetical protein